MRVIDKMREMCDKRLNSEGFRRGLKFAIEALEAEAAESEPAPSVQRFHVEPHAHGDVDSRLDRMEGRLDALEDFAKQVNGHKHRIFGTVDGESIMSGPRDTRSRQKAREDVR